LKKRLTFYVQGVIEGPSGYLTTNGIEVDAR